MHLHICNSNAIRFIINFFPRNTGATYNYSTRCLHANFASLNFKSNINRNSCECLTSVNISTCLHHFNTHAAISVLFANPTVFLQSRNVNKLLAPKWDNYFSIYLDNSAYVFQINRLQSVTQFSINKFPLFRIIL